MSGKILRNLFSRTSALNSNSRHVSSFKGSFGGQKNSVTKWYWVLTGTGVAVSYFAIKSLKSSNQIYALQPRRVSQTNYCFVTLTDYHFVLQDDLVEKAVKLTAREKRFIKFASVEYDGQIYCKWNKEVNTRQLLLLPGQLFLQQLQTK
jgi:hypothetical protein